MFVFTTLMRALFIVMALILVLTPVPEPELLIPEPMTPGKFLASLVPGWISRRLARRRHDTLEETNTIAWLVKVKETGNDPGRFTIGVSRRGEPVDIHLPRGRPPWEPAPPPMGKSMSMIPDRVTPQPVPLVPLTAPPPELGQRPWWMDQPVTEPAPVQEAKQPSDPRPWQAGDSGDPPTIVKGLRAIIDKDLGRYLKEIRRYGEK